MQRGETAQNLPEIMGTRRHVLIKSWGLLETKFAKPKIVSPIAMAKLAIANTSLEFLVINREIFIPKREIGRF